MKPLPEWMVERVAVDELDAEAPAEQLEEIAASNRDILSQLPPAQVAAEIDRRVRVERARMTGVRHRRLRVAVGFAAAAAAAVVLGMWLVGDGGRQRVAALDPASFDAGTRIKGQPRLVVHRQVADRAERLASGGQVASGDRLQLSYIAAGRRHGVVVSIDGRGEVTLHYPDRVEAPSILEQGRAVPLTHSYELDDAPTFERFLFVTSSRPIDPSRVVEAAKQIAAQPSRGRSRSLALPPGVDQTSFVVRKVAPR